jgi:hypothetical protein
MRTIELYKFEELKKDVQERALNTAREYITNNAMYNECLNSDLENELYYNLCDDFPFLDDIKIRFSLNCCQGDGVSFEGEIIGLDNLMELAKKVYNDNIPRKIKRIIPYLYSVKFEMMDFHYCHAYTVDTIVTDNYNDYGHNRFNKLCEQFEKDINNYRVDYCRKLEKIGYDFILDYGDDENMKKYINSMQLEFYKDGYVYKGGF